MAREGRHRREARPRLVPLGDADAVLLLDAHRELQRGERVEGKPRAEEGGVVLDRARGFAFEVQLADDELFDLGLEGG